ncbi:MAG: glycosyltransferase family 4 protein [Chloroflexi bacterium]|nr:glycosyltransferase family 4 protein [Chloroflexota bacterium]
MKTRSRKESTLCVVNYPLSPRVRGWIPLGKLFDTIQPLYETIYLVTGNLPPGTIKHANVVVVGNFSVEIERRRHLPLLIAFPIWLFNFLKGQAFLSWNLCRAARHTNKVLFFLGSVPSLIPVLLAKAMGKQVTTFVIDYLPESMGAGYGKRARLFYRLLTLLNYRLSDRLVIETESTMQWCRMEPHKAKVRAGAQLYVDTDRFHVSQPYESRGNTIGYLGRLTAEKGILQLLKAIPLLYKDWPDVKFVIGGDGILRDEVRRSIDELGIADRVEMRGWIPFAELPQFYNQMKLMVAPSFTETGIPVAVLEAMGYGTPVLLTAVGGVEDVVKDGLNGFILRGNSPSEIASGMNRALRQPDLKHVSDNARRTAEEGFSLEATRARYRAIFLDDRSLNIAAYIEERTSP